jgi:hypothetical protein
MGGRLVFNSIRILRRTGLKKQYAWDQISCTAHLAFVPASPRPSSISDHAHPMPVGQSCAKANKVTQASRGGRHALNSEWPKH